MSLKLRRLWIQLTSDRKRFAALCLFLCLGMLFWARLIIVSRMPRTAIADDPAQSTGKAMQKENTSDEDAARSLSEANRPIAIELSTDVQRDPFVISPTYFPKLTLSTDLSQEAGKSQVNATEEPYQAETRLTAQLHAAIATLRLEAVVAGSAAVINGRTYRAGDEVQVSGGELRQVEPIRFRLVEVSQRSAELEAHGRTFRIEMPTPGQ